MKRLSADRPPPNVRTDPRETLPCDAVARDQYLLQRAHRPGPVRGARPSLRRRDRRGISRHRHLPRRHDRGRRAARREPGALGGGVGLAGGPGHARHLRARQAAHAGRSPAAGRPRRRAPRPARGDGAGGRGRRRGRHHRRGAPGGRAPRADRGDPRLPRQPRQRHDRAAPISCTATRPTRTWTWPSAVSRRPSGSWR